MEILERIIQNKREEVEFLKKMPISFPSFTLPRRDFKSALLSRDLALIGELKKCSPSAGVIREDFEPVKLAQEIEEGGASALSVLTDSDFFCGSLGFLPILKLKTDLPLLMKDFIIDEFQIELGDKLGADAILLIARCLSREKLAQFLDIARNKGLQCLVEIHSEEDWDKIKGLPIEMVGINSRDLSNFQVNLERIIKLRDKIPPDMLVIAESGIKGWEDIKELKKAGIRAFLVGEAIMRAKDVKSKVKELLGYAEG